MSTLTKDRRVFVNRSGRQNDVACREKCSGSFQSSPSILAASSILCASCLRALPLFLVPVDVLVPGLHFILLFSSFTLYLFLLFSILRTFYLLLLLFTLFLHNLQFQPFLLFQFSLSLSLNCSIANFA